MSQLPEWVRVFADLDDEKIWTVPLICRKGDEQDLEMGAAKVRIYIQRRCEKLGIDHEPDGMRPGSNAKGWYGWKLKMLIPSTLLPDDLYASYQDRGQNRLKEQLKEPDSAPSRDEPVKAETEPKAIESIESIESIEINEVLTLPNWRKRIGLVAMVVAFSLITVAGFGAVIFNDPVNRIKWQESRGNLQWLRTKLNENDWTPYRSRIIAGIAAINKAQGDNLFLDDLDLTDNHIATFALPDSQIVIFKHGVLRLGSWVHYKGFSGFVSEVRPEKIIVIQGGEPEPIYLPRVVVFGRPEPWYYPVAINHGDWALLATLAEIHGFQPPPKETIGIHGNFRVSSFREFIDRTGPYVGVSFWDHELKLHHVNHPRTVVGFGDVLAWPLSLGRLLGHWQDVGIKIEGPDQLMNKRMVFSPMQIGQTMDALQELGAFKYVPESAGNE